MNTKIIELEAHRPDSPLSHVQRSLPPGEPAAKVKAIMEMADPVGYLEQLDAQVFYQLIKSAGWDQTHDLIQYATPRQIQNFVDFDCWTRDRLIPDKMDKWLLSLVTDASDAKLKTVARELDAEVLSIYFKTFLHVEELDEGRIPDHLEGDIGTSPDGVYAIVYPENDDRAALLRALIDRIYAVDRVLAWTLLEAVQWELMSEMEEFAYKWRNSRLEEFGFVTREEAVEAYQYVDPAKFRERLEKGARPDERVESIAPPRLDLPAVLEDELDEEFFAFRALSGVDDPTAIQRIIYQIGALTNRTMIADGIEPGEVESGREVVRRTLGYLSLGLEFLSRADLNAAARQLSEVPVKRIFQVGFSLPRKLQHQLAALEERPALTLLDGERYSLLNEDERALAESLDRPRPTFAWDWRRYEIFKSQEQLDSAAFRIGMIAFKQIWLFTVAGQTPDALGEALHSDEVANEPATATFDALFATWLARFILGEDPSLNPLRSTEIELLIERINLAPWDAEDGAAFFKPLLERINAHVPPGSNRLFTRWTIQTLARLDDEFAGVTLVDNPAIFQDVLLVR
jgi:hypothetical protein